MERVGTLVEQLTAQLQEGKQITDLLQTVQMIQSELLHLQTAQQNVDSGLSVALHIPSSFESVLNPADPLEDSGEKVVFTLEVNEQEIEEELEEIKRNAEAKNLLSLKHRPQFRFNPIEDTPTLSHQIISDNHPVVKPSVSTDTSLGAAPETSTNEPMSVSEEVPEIKIVEINDQLKKPARELSEAFSEAPIKDLKKAIGINDRFLYIQELFKGDEVMYDRSIKTINSFEAYAEAEFWIKKELKLKIGWNDQDEVVKQFDHLVKRRFNMI